MTTKFNFVAGRYPVEFIQRVLSEIDSGQYTAASARHAYRITGKVPPIQALKGRNTQIFGLHSSSLVTFFEIGSSKTTCGLPPNLELKEKGYFSMQIWYC